MVPTPWSGSPGAWAVRMRSSWYLRVHGYFQQALPTVGTAQSLRLFWEGWCSQE